MGKKKPKTAISTTESEKEECRRVKLRAMNERFEELLDESVFEGIHDERIYHSLRVTNTAAMHQIYADLCFCDSTKEYLILDPKGRALHRYTMQGKLLQPAYSINHTLIFTRMIWCDGAGCFVCYDPPAGEQIWMLDCYCLLLRSVKNEFSIGEIFYDETAKRIIVVDSHQSVMYDLESVREEAEGDKDLEPTKALTYVDPEFGPAWQLDCHALLPSHQQLQRGPMLLAAHSTILYLMPLERAVDEDGEIIQSEKVTYLKRQPNATGAPITALNFHSIGSLVIVGDKQGNVSTYSLDFDCLTRHNNAHDDPILWCVSHPSINGFLTYSSATTKVNNDNDVGARLQVWSCNFREKLETIGSEVIGRIILARAVVESVASIVILTPAKLVYLTMHQAYVFFAPLSSKTRELSSSRSPMYSTKIIALSNDNSVRLLSASGKLLNLQILPAIDPFNVVSAVLSGNQNQLFTIIMKSGEILVSDANVSPMKFLHVFVNDDHDISCITVYEYFDEIRDEAVRPRKKRTFYPIRIRIIAGTKDGKLVVINESTGKHEIVLPAHNGSVIQLKSLVTTQRAISLGIDNCVKVWRIFADLYDPLVLYYTLNFTVRISHVDLMGLILCMANSSKTSKTHQLMMENMQKRVRLKHPNSKDHTAQIINVVTCEELEICATSSLDNTIRIWDEENCLLKILELNICAQTVTFSSILGDIVFNAGRHLYKISHQNYLSPKYRAKIVAKELTEETVNEDIVAEDVDYTIYDDVVDRNLILQPVISTPLASLDATSTNKPRPDVLILQQICALYDYRDEDIRKIRNHEIKSQKGIKSKATMLPEVWEKYANDLLDSLKQSVPEVPEYNFKNLKEKLNTEKKTYNERGVFQMRYGYSADEIVDTENLEELVKNAGLPLKGFLPNSILYKEKEKEVPKAYIPEEKPAVKRELPKYKYPREFYPQEEENENIRRSIRLSELMGIEGMDLDDTM